MSFDGLMLAATVREAAASLTGARVNKVYQPGDHEIVLHLWGRAANHKLLISAHPQHARLHLTALSFENPPTPPAFCMLLRKHLEGSRLLSIEQPGWERVAFLRFSGTDELGLPSERILVAETMGRSSNLILLDGERRVLAALRRSSADSVRPVWPGQPYVPPPAQDKVDPLGPELFDRLRQAVAGAGLDFAAGAPAGAVELRANAASADALASLVQRTVAGFSPVNAREAVHRAWQGSAAAALAEPVTAGAAAGALSASIAGLAAAAREQPQPHAHPLANGRTAFAPFPLTHLGAGAPAETFATCWQLLDHVFGARIAVERLEQQRNALARQVREQLARHQRKLQRQQEALAAAAEADHLRLCGELLTASLHAIPPGAASVRLANWYDPDGGDIEIALDPQLSPAANAQQYFKRFRKAQATLTGAGAQAEKTQAELAYLEQVEQMIAQAATLDDVAEIRAELAGEGYIRLRPQRDRSRLAGERPRQGRRAHAGHGRRSGDGGRRGAGGHEPSPPLQFRSSDGLDILVGRNNRQNDWLTLRRAAPDDIWLHAKELPGSHVVLVLPPGVSEPPPRSLQEAAALAALHSKGRQSGQVPVDYTARRHVHKPRGAKPGMVIYDHHRTVYARPDAELAERLRVT